MFAIEFPIFSFYMKTLQNIQIPISEATLSSQHYYGTEVNEFDTSTELGC